jgi:hypothetical protein
MQGSYYRACSCKQRKCAYIEPHQEHVYILIRRASAIHTLRQSQNKKWPILPARQKVLVALIQLHKSLHN